MIETPGAEIMQTKFLKIESPAKLHGVILELRRRSFSVGNDHDFIFRARVSFRDEKKLTEKRRPSCEFSRRTKVQRPFTCLPIKSLSIVALKRKSTLYRHLTINYVQHTDALKQFKLVAACK